MARPLRPPALPQQSLAAFILCIFYFWLRLVLARTPYAQPTCRCASVYCRSRGAGEGAPEAALGSAGRGSGVWGDGPCGGSRLQLGPGAGGARSAGIRARRRVWGEWAPRIPILLLDQLRKCGVSAAGWGLLNLAGAVLASRIHKVVVWILLVIWPPPPFGQLGRGGDRFLCSYPML